MDCVGNGRRGPRWTIVYRRFSIPAAAQLGLLAACALGPGTPSAAASPQATPAECAPGPGFGNCMLFGYTGADQRFVVPPGATNLRVQMWGAGGGAEPGYGTDRPGAGAGGFTTGTVAVSGGERITVTVGEGGASDGAPGYGGGGAGGPGAPGPTGGSGGGMSALWDGTYGSTPLFIAGGGGGSAAGAVISGRLSGSAGISDTGGAGRGAGGALASATAGGAGGGGEGESAGLPGSGLGGTQIAGGAAAVDVDEPGCQSSPTAGARFQGGNGAGADGSAADGSGSSGAGADGSVAYEPGGYGSGGGGGGGGYYGGGGGLCQVGGGSGPGGGGGGSGFVGGPGATGASVAGASGLTAESAAGPLPAGTINRLYRPGVGDGGGLAGNGNGGNGEVVIEWNTQVSLSVQSAAPSSFVPGRPLTYTLTVRNGGPSNAAGVKIRDRLSARLRHVTWRCRAFRSASRCGHASGWGDIRTRADIAAHGKVVYTITGMTSPDALSLTATATVRSPRRAFKRGCQPECRATYTSTARPQFTLQVIRTLDPGPGPLVPGARVTYALTVRNGGPSDAFGARVAGPMPRRLRSVTWTCRAAAAPSKCLGTSGAGGIDTIADIAAGGSVTYTVTGTVPPGRARVAVRAASPPEPAPLRRAADSGCARQCSPPAALPPLPSRSVPGDDYVLDLAAGLWILLLGALFLLIRGTRRKAAERRRAELAGAEPASTGNFGGARIV
jgi:uncharacterized repeat protein (TIGR01451 family)